MTVPDIKNVASSEKAILPALPALKFKNVGEIMSMSSLDLMHCHVSIIFFEGRFFSEIPLYRLVTLVTDSN